MTVDSNLIWHPGNPRFNYFLDIPYEFRKESVYDEFINVCTRHPAWGAKYIIGKGDFELGDFQAGILDMLWKVPFPLLVGSRGMGKTFILAIYALLKATLSQNSAYGEKIVIIGSAFRQSKLVFDEIVKWAKQSPLIMECKPKITMSVDKCQMTIGRSTITALPLGTGDKIRGYRATIVIADEYAKIPDDIFQTVVRGFAAVSRDPIKRAKRMAEMKRLIEEGLLEKGMELEEGNNQIILSSTAWYTFNHFYKTYEKYMSIIQNKVSGNAAEYSDVFGDDVPEEKINWKNFAVCKIPYTELPEGYMDEVQLSQARLTMSDDAFRMEFMAQFISDTDGFFKRSAIEDCTIKYITDSEGNKKIHPDAFAIELVGTGRATYVMAIDPARAKGGDNFAIVILKVENSRMKIVYLKTLQGTSHIKAAEKIRDLVDLFDISAIGIDKGGGGQTLADILQDPDLAIKQGKERIFDKDDEQYRPLNNPLKGKHIIELINYQGEWLRNANFDLKADFDNQRVLFPHTMDEEKYMGGGEAYENSSLQEANEVWYEIDQAKDEICTIAITSTGKSETIHFGLPENNDNVLGTKRKDRYSAILIGSDIGRRMIMGEHLKPDDDSIYGDMGGWLEEFQ